LFSNNFNNPHPSPETYNNTPINNIINFVYNNDNITTTPIFTSPINLEVKIQNPNPNTISKFSKYSKSKTKSSNSTSSYV
jgi:hypothetical protein